MKMRLAAIDIGSNAARLLISDVSINNEGKTEFNKINLVRVPLRLGFDVFEKKAITPEKTDMILHTIKAYKHLIEAYNVDHVKAAATSAMRDAINAQEIIDRVRDETGIVIEVISGGSEASLIYENHIAESFSFPPPLILGPSAC
jgi:exopolyphosphatase/guanosine-5'-triphosphate,3'-diphosphate pyrophosphatase